MISEMVCKTEANPMLSLEKVHKILEKRSSRIVIIFSFSPFLSF